MKKISETNAPLVFKGRFLEYGPNVPRRPGVVSTLEGKIQAADTVNGNKRVYPLSLWQKSLQREDVQERLRGRRMVGELDHPESGATSYARVSHVMTEVNLRPNGEVWGKLDVLDTPAGKILNSLAQAEVTLGISSRGDGSTREGDDGVTVVEDDFIPETWDIVVNPSTPGAFVGIAESVETRNVRVAEAMRALVNGTEEVSVLFESYKVISELESKNVGGPYGTLREEIAAKLKHSLGSCGCSRSESPNTESQESVMEMTEKQIQEKAAALAATMVEASRAEMRKQFEQDAQNNLKTIRTMSQEASEMKRRLKAAEGLIDQFALNNRKLKEATPAPNASDSDRIAKLEKQLAAAKSLLEAALKAIEKLKGASKKAEAAERLVVCMVEHMRGSKRRLHIERLLKNEPNPQAIRKVLESQTTIRGINETLSQLRVIQGPDNGSREPLPGSPRPTFSNETLQESQKRAANNGSASFTRMLVGRIPGGV